MTEVRKEQVSKQAQDLFNRGFGAFERGNLEHAIEMLLACVELEPGFLQARKFLRAAEVAQFKRAGGGALARGMAGLKGMAHKAKVQVLLSAGKTGQALMAAEKLLRIDPLNVENGLAFARAAIQADLPEAAVQTLEVIREHHPVQADLLRQLGSLYREIGAAAKARECFEKLCDMFPNDPDAIKALKDATAVESMATDGWSKATEGGTYRDMIKDEGEAVRLEKESKAVKSESDVDQLIGDMLAKIEAEPGNVNYYRALARLHIQKEAFDEAIAALSKAMELTPGDPELDNALSQTRVQKFEHEIKQLRAAGDEEGAAAREHERLQFVFDDLQERVARYPNDPALRFEWGRLLFENDYFNEAVQQFQVAQRNPKHRIRSLYYMGLAFKAKGQNDLARDQLETANAELGTMDQTKKDVCYELGQVYEAMGDTAKAGAIYKQIYQADIGYRDIATKIESMYNQ